MQISLHSMLQDVARRAQEAAVPVVKVFGILIGAWLVTYLASRLLHQLRVHILSLTGRRGAAIDRELEKRAATIIGVLRRTVNSVIWVVAIVMALQQFYPIEPLLAGLGVAGLALGLGAQTLIKDYLGGLFLLWEDQIRIGDGVTINGISGSVEEINLRTTVLRGENGSVHTIPNGSITVLTNATREYSYYMFETVLAHRADADKALEILRETGVELASQERFAPVLLAPIEIIGVDRLGERGAVIRARIKTLPGRQWDYGRELNRVVKERFDGAEIEFPPPS
jgi:small conductance mechanosensitive channel